MTEMKFHLVDDGIKVKYVPEAGDLANCVELGRKVGQALKEKK
jgi:flavorubredoxin